MKISEKNNFRPDILKKIQIYTKRLVNDIFAGQYSSVFKGRGMEFSEVREYQPGDDVRFIDWNVTARFGHPFVKKFSEERELTIMLLIDMSGSEKFATTGKFKSEIIAEISSILAFSAIKNNDKIGMIIFTDIIEKYVPPKKTSSHILRLIRDILYFKPLHNKTDLRMALEFFSKVQKKKSVLFIISDFFTQDYEKMLKIVNKKHDVIAVVISDPREKLIPENIGFVELTDLETQEDYIIDTSDKEFIKYYNKISLEKEENLKKFFSKIDLDYIKISTDKSYIEPLLRFFYLRSRRFH